MIDEFVSHPSGVDLQLIFAIDANDLDEVQRIVSKVDADLAQQHFYDYEVITRAPQKSEERL
jgi:hypothetical protein